MEIILNYAIQMAKKSDCQNRHGAVIFSNGKAWSSGHNYHLSGYRNDNPTVHAEVMCGSRWKFKNHKG